MNLDQISRHGQKNKGDWIKVGMSTCGIAAGADKVLETLIKEKQERKIDILIEKCGCSGMCHAEPLVEVCVKGMPTVVYGRVDEETAIKIIDKHALGKYLLNDHIYNIKVN
ncbi:MAG: (2Fe-2S) ferredoxin domain-containing protein [Candidatus Omnitrophica bacterium]|nr:(2Fe-2S) ferredoxin domain-containing protein [Candidatus Omnitrophota bacterium]